MDRQLKVSHETVGTSSYITITYPADVKVIHYQLEMILSNDIKKFLSVSRQSLDGETVVFYNITSRICLADVLKKRKLTRKELICLIDGAVSAIRDASDFRLPSSGILMEAENIYVNPSNCDPAFVFLPIENPGGYGLKELLSDLILKDQIEMADDNLIQILLKELNSQPFCPDQLENSLKPYRTGKAPRIEEIEKPLQKPSPQVNRTPQPQMPQYQMPQFQMPQYQMPQYQMPEYQVPDSQAPRKESFRPQPPKEEADRVPEINVNEKDKRKKLFLLPQALVMVVTAAGISFGLFLDENGNLAVNTVLAFVIILAVAEVILYREIYVNKKEGKKPGKAPKAAKGKKTPPKKAAANSRPAPPKKQLMQEAEPAAVCQTPVSSPAPKAPVPKAPIPKTPAPKAPVPPAARTFAAPPMQPAVYEPEDGEAEGETELWEENSGGNMAAYLEYYEDGVLQRIPVDPVQGVLIGRLRAQVDFALKSPRVGKIHARFFYENGQYYVVDINSKNGTYINGNGIRIESNTPYPLHDKDRIMLADSEFTIRCTDG